MPESVTFTWEARPAVELVRSYLLYELTATSKTLLATTQTNESSVLLSDGHHVIAVAAANVVGEGKLSDNLHVFVSGTSVVAVTNKPGAPIGLTIK